LLQMDYYAHFNGLRHSHPAEKAATAALIMAFCLASSSPLTYLLAIFFSAWLVVGRARVPLLFYLKMLCLPASFLAVGVACVAISVSGDPQTLLWWWPCGRYYLGISAQGARTAAGLFFKSLGVASGLYFLALPTPCV